jgi:Domain of unknown function (DUF1998)
LNPVVASRVGELRPSQLLWSFGVGAVVDLPNFSVMVLGLDDWDHGLGQTISEERLLAAVRRALSPTVGALVTPPTPPESEGPFDPLGEAAGIGVPVTVFPEWFRCPICQVLAPVGTRLFEFKGNVFRPDLAKFVHTGCSRARGRPPTAVPARFVVACERGHIDDFPWTFYVHAGRPACRGTLTFYEIGASLETANLFVKCNECDRSRSMIEAFDKNAGALPKCRGRHPHLRDFEANCPAPLRAMLLGASNSWFPETRSVLSVPNRGAKLEQLIEANWGVLDKATSVDVLKAFREIGQLKELRGFSDDEVWTVVKATRMHLETSGEEVKEELDLKRPEWDVLAAPDPTLNGKDFMLTPSVPPPRYSKELDSVILAERLREVNALIGFTRILSPGESAEGEARSRRAPLSGGAMPKWVPATEVRGEGVFIRFDLRRVSLWTEEQAQAERRALMRNAHSAWRNARHLEPAEAGFPDLVYIMLHTFSHALMREFALECGYNAASIRERIYASRAEERVDMAGILIYTAAPDSEGTLGGLVGLGHPQELGRLMRQALERAALCASDPFCSEHDPRRDGTLHGAACHACLFAPETSCENGNRYLDRTTLVPTFGAMSGGFFAAST